MTEDEAVASVLKALAEAEVPHMLVGSFSSNAYGIARSTKDVDIVVQLGDKALGKIFSNLPDGLKLESQVGFETITSSTRYRINLRGSRFMAELFEVTEDPHDQLRFANRLPTNYAGIPTFIPRAEDVVIMKLRWSRGRPRGKDIDDIANVLSVQRKTLDLNYIRNWCGQHGTLELFEKTLASLPPLA